MSLIKIIVAVSILWLSSPVAVAASFDCGKAASRTERLICSDPKLSKVDEELNVAYQHALERLGPDKELLRNWQRDWLKNNIMQCDQPDCIRYRFISRIDLLEQIASYDSSTARWNGRYVRYRNGKKDPRAASILLIGLKDNRTHVDGVTSWLGPDGKNSELDIVRVDGPASLKGNRAFYNVRRCSATMAMRDETLVVEKDFNCGAMDLTFAGEYRKQ